jgi:hypothetical protein
MKVRRSCDDHEKRDDEYFDIQTGRYRVLAKSKSHHCCFEATVVDTENGNDNICECFDSYQAEEIALALNLVARARAGVE